jgi:T-complex protein 1 subunit theta
VPSLNIAAAGMVKKVTKAKVAVFTSALDVAQTETKGTVLIKNADEMLNFTRGEEKHLEKVYFLGKQIKKNHIQLTTPRFHRFSKK